MRDCTHRWRVTRDWQGDPTIPYGTHSWPVWVCRKCGEETTEQPEDWEPEPEPEYERPDPAMQDWEAR